MLTLTRLQQLLDYNPDTGQFTWRQFRGQGAPGMVAGRVSHKGHRQIGIDGRMYSAHRLAWMYVYGTSPAAGIDHINRVKDDNRIANLRLATVGQNRANSGVSRNNKSGVKGVRQKGDRWQAVIWDGKNCRHLGMFDSPEEASAAYQAAAIRKHGEFAAIPQARALLPNNTGRHLGEG